MCRRGTAKCRDSTDKGQYCNVAPGFQADLIFRIVDKVVIGRAEFWSMVNRSKGKQRKHGTQPGS